MASSSFYTLTGNVTYTPVTTVFGRVGTVVAEVGDYSFDQIGGTATAAQLPAISTLTGMVATGQLPLGTSMTFTAPQSFIQGVTVTGGVAADTIAASGSASFAGTVTVSALPTADPHAAGQLWSNSGVVTVSAG